MNRSEHIGDLAAALAKARSAFASIGKDKTARIVSPKGTFSYTYADLATVVDATNQALAANDLAILQPTSLANGMVVVTTILVHASGQWVSEEMAWPVVATDNRSIGSGITYARRHSLLAMVAGAATDEDDDAEAARGGDRETERVSSYRREPEVLPDPELVARLETSIAIARGQGTTALEELKSELASLPESTLKNRMRQLYKDAWTYCRTLEEQAEKQTAPPTADPPPPTDESPVPPLSLSPPPSETESGTGQNAGGRTKRRTSRPSEVEP